MGTLSLNPLRISYGRHLIDNVRYFSHIRRGVGLVGKREGLRKVREEGRWSPPTRGEVPKLSQVIQIDEGKIQDHQIYASTNVGKTLDTTTSFSGIESAFFCRSMTTCHGFVFADGK